MVVEDDGQKAEFDDGLSLDETLMEAGGAGVDSDWGELGRAGVAGGGAVNVVRLLME